MYPEIYQLFQIQLVCVKCAVYQEKRTESLLFDVYIKLNEQGPMFYARKYWYTLGKRTELTAYDLS